LHLTRCEQHKSVGKTLEHLLVRPRAAKANVFRCFELNDKSLEPDLLGADAVYFELDIGAVRNCASDRPDCRCESLVGD
jgi:hypothetical protein